MSRVKKMNDLARDISAEVKCQIPPDAVFALTIFKPGPKGFTTYASNASREETIEALRDLLLRLEKSTAS